MVATKVGGVPEILPQDMIEFCRADEDGMPFLKDTARKSNRWTDVIRALTHAIHTIQSSRHSPWSAHTRVRDMYSWSHVSSRAEIVYLRALSRPHREIGERMRRYLELGPVFGIVMCCILAVEHYFSGFSNGGIPGTKSGKRSALQVLKNLRIEGRTTINEPKNDDKCNVIQVFVL